jgi:hypothetical protein
LIAALQSIGKMTESFYRSARKSSPSKQVYLSLIDRIEEPYLRARSLVPELLVLLNQDQSKPEEAEKLIAQVRKIVRSRIRCYALYQVAFLKDVTVERSPWRALCHRFTLKRTQQEILRKARYALKVSDSILLIALLRRRFMEASSGSNAVEK